MVHLQATALVLAGSIVASNALVPTRTFRDNIKTVVVLIQENRLAALHSGHVVFADRIHDFT